MKLLPSSDGYPTVRQGPTALTVGADGGCLAILFLSSFSLWLDID